jgi:hypothetical protein
VREYCYELVVPAALHAKFLAPRQLRPNLKAICPLPSTALEHHSGAEVETVTDKLVIDLASVDVFAARVATTSRFRLIIHGLLPE